MTDTNSYTVESLSSPYGGHVPWCDARREEGLTERDSIRRYNELYRWYHPDGNSWAERSAKLLGAVRAPA